MNNKDLKPELWLNRTMKRQTLTTSRPQTGVWVSGVRAWTAGTPTAGTSVSRTGEKTVTAGLKGDVKKTPSDPIP